MPQIPVIVPLIVVGLLVGSMIKSGNSRISKKRLASASLAAGLFNSIHAYVVYSLTPVQIPAGFRGVTNAGSLSLEGLSSTSEASFVIASFLAAFLMVLLVFAVAMVYARVRGGKEPQEIAELTSEEEAAFAPG